LAFVEKDAVLLDAGFVEQGSLDQGPFVPVSALAERASRRPETAHSPPTPHVPHEFGWSFKLRKAYLTMRMSYICGKLMVKKRADWKKRLPEMKDALEEKEDLEQWEGGLDGVVGLVEWKSLVATFERGLMWLPKVRYKSLI
jgi:hypothetical protein